MSRRIRLLMTTSDLGGGGAEREFVNLLRHLDRSIFEIHVCLWRKDKAYPAPEDLPVSVLGKTKPWHLPRTIRRLAGQIDALKPDLVFSLLQYPNLVTGTSLLLARHAPRWICRFVSPPEIELAGWKHWWAKRVMSRADVIIGCAKGLCEALIDHLKLPAAKVLMVSNPVDVESIERLSSEPLPQGFAKRGFCFLHVGRLSPEKNQRLLLESFAASQIEGAELWMLGSGPLEQELRVYAGRLGIAEKVRWLGFLSNPYPFFRHADAFVMSSNWEGFPMVLVEAMLCGTLAISTACTYGPEELITNNESGLLVPVGSVEALSSAMRKAFTEPTLREKLAMNGKMRVRERFAGRVVFDRYQNLFRELGEDHR